MCRKKPIQISFLILLGLLMTIGCNSNSEFLSNAIKGDPKPFQNSSSDRPTDSSEGIPGYSLGCSFVRDDNPTNNDSIGCLIADEKNRKVKLENLATTWQWQVEGDPKLGVVVIKNEQPEASHWHIIFELIGLRAAIDTYIKTARIALAVYRPNEESGYVFQHDFGNNEEVAIAEGYSEGNLVDGRQSAMIAEVSELEEKLEVLETLIIDFDESLGSPEEDIEVKASLIRDRIGDFRYKMDVVFEEIPVDTPDYILNQFKEIEIKFEFLLNRFEELKQ